MNVGQYMFNPAIVGAGLGLSYGAIQKYGHDESHSIAGSATTGAVWGLGVGAAYLATRTTASSLKVGSLTNPFKSAIDTSGMTPQQIAVLKQWGGTK